MGRDAALLAVAVMALAGCGKAGPAAAPVLVKAAEVETLIHGSCALNGKRVSLDGWVDFDNGPMGHGIAMAPTLRSQPYGAGDPVVLFNVEYGQGPNQLDLHEIDRKPPSPSLPIGEVLTFDPRKATFQDAAGAAHPLGDKVRVTGRLVYPNVRRACVATGEESGPSKGQRFKPRLTDVVLERAV